MTTGLPQSDTPATVAHRESASDCCRRGPKPENGICRVRLLKCGPFVKQETEDILMAWKRIYGITPGRAIDQVIAYVSRDARFQLNTKNE
jgi:hypothetical protein